MIEKKDILKVSRKAEFDMVVAAASAGGLKAISVVLSGLPSDFPAAILVVQHLDPRHPSRMADILSKRTVLKLKQAEEGDHVSPGNVYIASPNFHLMVNHNQRLNLSDSERVHFLRPCADLLFESAAAVYKHRVIALILTGTGSDGTRGAKAIRNAGGKVIVQDKETSEFFGMPGSVIKAGEADYILPLKEISTFLYAVVSGSETIEQP